MANTSDITLTNALAATTAGFWTREWNPKLTVMSRAPFFRLLRENNRIFTTETFKTGMNLFDQSIGSSTETASLTISATNEVIKMPTYTEYNLLGLNKKLILTKEQVSLLTGAMSSLQNASLTDKRKEALVRRNVQNLREKTMMLHYRQMFYDVDRRLLTAVTGSNCKSLESVISPSTGPASSFNSALDLTALDVTVNRPLWVAASTGTGTTNLGTALTGDTTMNYANMLKWVALMIETQEFRGNTYTHIIVHPTVRSTLAHLAENSIQYNLDPRVTLSVIKPNSTVQSDGIHLDSYRTAVIVNGLPVVADPALTANNVWLIDINAIEMDVFEDTSMTDEYYEDSPMKDKEAIIRTYARMAATTTDRWSDEAIVAMVCYFQLTYNNFGGIGLVVFDSTSTT